jgi:hypothetical protein
MWKQVNTKWPGQTSNGLPKQAGAFKSDKHDTTQGKATRCNNRQKAKSRTKPWGVRVFSDDTHQNHRFTFTASTRGVERGRPGQICKDDGAEICNSKLGIRGETPTSYHCTTTSFVKNFGILLWTRLYYSLLQYSPTQQPILFWHADKLNQSASFFLVLPGRSVRHWIPKRKQEHT